MTPTLRRSLAALALVFGGATTALAQARIEDCEKIQAADAYNQCLAKFGPTSKVRNVTPPQPGDVKGSGEEAAAGAAAKAPAATRGGRHAAGRQVSSRHVARGRRGGRHYATRASGRKTATKASGRKRMTITVQRRH